MIVPGTSHGAAATDAGPASSTAAAGGDRKVSVAQGGAATATATTEGSITRNGVASSPEKSSPSGKDKKKDNSDDEDEEKPPVVDFNKIIQDTFEGAQAEAFGAFHDSTRVYSRRKEYEGARNCTFAVDHLLDEVDRLGQKVENKAQLPCRPELRTPRRTLQTQRRPHQGGASSKTCRQGFARRAPPTPPKSVEEAADKMKERGISSEAFRLIWQETHF